ncbi:MAG: hypothetical protein ABH875_01810 [Candidatus Omnitrophota bacterium]
MVKIAKIVAPIILVSLILAGCGGVNEDKPIAEVRTEAQAMTAKDLQAMVDKYNGAIESKRAEIKKLGEKLSKIPVTELVGKDAQALKGNMDDINKSLRALSERLNVYMRELNNKK